MKLLPKHGNFLKIVTHLSHLYPLQVENCGSNSRLVVDEDDDGKFRIERVKSAKTLGFSILSCEKGPGLRPRTFFTAKNGELFGLYPFQSVAIADVDDISFYPEIERVRDTP